jgi:hypothetical protein
MAHPHMAYCTTVLMPEFNLKVGEMMMGLVMSKLVGRSPTLLLLLEVLLFPSSPKNIKNIYFSSTKVEDIVGASIIKEYTWLR